MVNTEELLKNHIAGIFAQLIAGSVDKQKAAHLIEDLKRAQRTLAMGEGLQDDTYALCPRAIDAVVKYLERRDAPASEEEIIKALLAGGFRGGKRENARTIHGSIAIFLRGTGKDTGTLREVNGLIGRGEWPDSKFEG